jgi:hypothetical protein
MGKRLLADGYHYSYEKVQKMSLREKLTGLGEEELIDIIELQLEEIKSLKQKSALYTSPYKIKVTFNKNKPKPFDI